MKGSVKMFNKEKGYGFIHTEEGKDVFFHYSELLMDNFKTVDVGQAVEFVVLETDRGPRASKITIVKL